MMCVCCIAELPTVMCLWYKDGCINHVESDDVQDIRSDRFELSLDNSEKEEKTFKDPISTGRKRAAVMYPISVGQICDWAWHKQCGGGVEPIIGCAGRPATNIHHGPDKSTFNNDRESNISIICTFCHNRWHVANDKYYELPRPEDNSIWVPTNNVGERKVYALTDIQKATKMEILTNEMMIPEGGSDARRT